MKVTRAIVPGKIMLAGEYAVLDGGRCLSVAVDQWLEARAQENPSYEIHSDLWSAPETLPEHTCAEPLLQTAAMAQKLWFPEQGFSLTIRSQLKVSFGLGSSSAVRLASLMALAKLAGEPLTIDEAGRMVRELQMGQQSFASGYDVLTQSRGGLLLWTPDYQSWPGPARKLEAARLHPWLHVYGGGSGAPTGQQGTSVRTWLKETQKAGTLAVLSESLVDGFLQVIEQGWAQGKSAFLERLIPHRRFFEAAPGFPHTVAKHLMQVPGFDQDWSFKTTGAGGEDALLLFGTAESLVPAHETLVSLGWSRLDLAFSEEGASCEEIL